MARVLLGLSHEYAYFKGEPPAPVKDLPHDPWFWCIPEKAEDPEAVRQRVVKAWESKSGDLAASGSDDLHPLQKIKAIGPLKEVQSFVHFGQRRKAFPVFAKRSYYVPDISDELFARHGVFTAEHDVPYQQRAMIDLAAGVFENADGKRPGQFWPFDTHGEKVKLKVLVYDIETTQWDATAKKQVPVDMLGWAEFEIGYRASVDLDKEEFNFEITDPAPDWKDVEVFQDEAPNLESEIRLLTQFVRRVPGYDIVSGHNILGFDNKQVYERIQNLLDDRSTGPSLGPNEKRAFDQFARVWASKDRTFTFGNQQDIVSFHPTSLDTLNAARRFYFFLDDFGLKRLAPFMGVNVPDRVYLTPQELKVGDGATRMYNRHDVQEQVGVTTKLLAQALPLAFTAGWTFEELLTAGNVKMWDHMGMIRAARTRKLAMPTSRARGIARSIIDLVGKSPTREQVWTRARGLAADRESAQKSKEFIRVAKYGDEMPEFVEIPGLVINPKAVDAQRAADQGEEAEEVEEEEYLGYSIPGGMTLHPQELGSHFVPWWHVVTADVGAMYPTILRARNVSADTIRLARKGETPDAWVWFFRVSDEFLQDPRWVTRPATKEESYGQDKALGVMVGIKKNPAIGVTASAMKAVMSIAARVKKALGAAKKDPKFSKVELEQLQMMYASLKANRNAGTHGQMLAVGVSCRGFNMFAGAEITTLGQKILADVQGMLQARGARVIYGDSIVGSRCVVVKDPDDRVRVLPVERLFEEVGGEAHVWHGKEAVAGNGWMSLSMAASGPVRASEWRPIVRVIRHGTDKQILRVRQPEGETICTEDHSIMAERDGVVQRMRPEDIGNASLVRVRVPPNSQSGPIDLLPYLKPLAEKLEAELGPPRRAGVVNKSRPRFGYDDTHIWFATWRNPHKVKRFIQPSTPECSALCRLLGAYVSEGSVNWGLRQGASIANSDRPWIEEVQRDVLTLFDGFAAGIVESDPRPERQITLKDGSVVVYKDRTLKVQMTNKLGALFFWALGGKGSVGKRVPDFLFNLPTHHQGEFLASAIAGDGSWVNDQRYTPLHRRTHFSYTTKSLELASGLAVLMSQMGYDYGMRHQTSKGVHVIFTRDGRKPAKEATVEPWSDEGPVYDLQVEGTHTFVDAYGPILLHNTDGIYIGTSKSARNFPEVAEAMGEPYEPGNTDSWYILPDEAEKAIALANDAIRKFLDYEAFELEAEDHDCMVFVVHKNYLIFDVKKGKLEMVTKGNNFRGSDKAPVAQTLLKEIMRRSLKDLAVWEDEAKAREALQAAIKKHTRDVIKEFDASTVDMRDLTLVQVVQPESSYKPNPDGSPSIWIKRARALELVTKEKLRASKKYRFVVCKKPLPGIDKPSKTGIKPLDYMWPIDGFKGHTEVDLDWYKDMIEKYVRGAFGFEDLELHTQKGLDAWM